MLATLVALPLAIAPRPLGAVGGLRAPTLARRRTLDGGCAGTPRVDSPRMGPGVGDIVLMSSTVVLIPLVGKSIYDSVRDVIA